MAVCEYCGGVSYWNEQGLVETGKRSMLSEGFTRLYRGATGTLRGKRFRVEGRARYSFGKGFWDEWFLIGPDGSQAWWTEDDHELALQTRREPSAPLDTEHASPGATITFEGGSFVVLEVGRARCLGVEGSLPDTILPEDTLDYLDATTPDGRFALAIEGWDEGAQEAYLGEWLGQDDLVLDDEGPA
jgi:hypothetical protein